MSNDKPNLDSLFLAASEIESKADRDAFLADACGEDLELRQQIEQLLQSDQHAGSFLEKPAPGLEPTIVPDAPGENRSAAQNAESSTAFSVSEAVVIGDANPSVLKSIGMTLEGVPRISLRESPEEGEEPVQRPSSPEIPDQSSDSRYRIDGEIARGGMGAVMRGRDTDLGRDLAVKVLLDEHKDKPHVVQRFIEEAQIGGQLQHPGIAPVYELGQFADQRPFFTMKLVKGKTLSALLEDRSSPDEDRAKFLGIFEQICQTMAYAHSRGVIHRDLKPSNIMVGAFGEVQVMDWGLAKVLSEGGVADEKRSIDKRTNLSIIQTIRSLGSDTPASFGSGSAGSHTQMGSVMGTPAYMPPEQALGEIDRLDQRSDVFGLGAILCEILTGQPPYTGENHTEVFRKASRAKLDDCFSELESQKVDAELLEIVRGTLAPEPEDRIRDASVLTERVSNHLASLETRMRAAELAKVEANTKATEERKRRKVMMALAASVLLTMGVGGAGWLYSKQKDFALRQAEADAERQKQIERLEDRQRFLAEVTTAESLLAESNTVLPTQIAIQEAQSAIERVEAAGGPSDELDPEDKQRLESARDTVTQLAADRRLLESLQSCWQYENEYEAARRLSLLDSEESEGAGTADGQDSNMIQNEDDAPKAIAELASPAEKYESAFSDWGLRLSDEDAAKQFSRMHPDVLPAAFVSLDRWRERLVFSRSLDEWREESWSVLKPVSLRSRGGDKLEILEDQSILASGDNPHMGYELKFETDMTTLVAFRLEALTHDSLPNSGPGRSTVSYASGIFSLQGIEVWYAPRSRPDDRRRLWFQSAVADYSYNYSTVHSLTTESWMVGRRSGKDHEAVFECRDSPTDTSGFFIFISHADRAPGLWGGENIGRFRWSVSNEVDGRKQADSLAKLSEEVDIDAWRAELRSEIERNDLAALVDRARNHEQLEQQPLVSQFQLVDALMENKSGGTLLRFINRDSTWQTARATDTQVSSTETYTSGFAHDSSISIDRLDDGSYSIDGSYLDFERLELVFDWSERLPTAVKLELLPEKRDGNLAFGRSDSGWVDLVDFSVGVRRQSAGDNVEFQEVPIYEALSDLPTHRPLRLWATFDGNRRTYSPLFDSGNQHQIVYLLGSDTLDAEGLSTDNELRIKLETTRHIARFRLSFSTDEFEVPDAKEEALDLARFVCEQNPHQYWAQVKLANTCLAQRPPRFEEAMSHAMAAYALEPNNPSSSSLLVKATPTDRLAEDESLQRATILALNRLASKASSSSVLTDHMESIFNAARQSIEIDPDKAAALFEFIVDARPDDEAMLGKATWQIVRIVKDGIQTELPLALRAYHRVVELNPMRLYRHNNLGSLYEQAGQNEKAIEYYRKEITLYPDKSGIPYSNLARYAAQEGDLSKAIELCRKGASNDPKDARISSDLGGYLLEAEKFDEALSAYQTAVEQQPKNPSYMLGLANVIAKLHRTDEAEELRQKAIAIGLDPNRTASQVNDLAWELLTAEDETLRDYAVALKLVTQAMKKSTKVREFNNTLGVAHYRNGNWQEAKDALLASLQTLSGNSYDMYFLAMTEWQLGNKEKARQWYDEATAWMNQHQPHNAELIRFRDEAEKLMQIARP